MARRRDVASPLATPVSVSRDRGHSLRKPSTGIKIGEFAPSSTAVRLAGLIDIWTIVPLTSFAGKAARAGVRVRAWGAARIWGRAQPHVSSLCASGPAPRPFPFVPGSDALWGAGLQVRRCPLSCGLCDVAPWLDQVAGLSKLPWRPRASCSAHLRGGARGLPAPGWRCP